VSRDPVPLGESLNGLVRSLRGPTADGSAATSMGGVFGRWDETVGEAVARHVQPIKLDGATLVVEVDDPAWATQLKFLEANLRERLLASTGARIDTFEIRVRRTGGR
jgi:predicted nucleic acid-binding Zn ribbon protein